MKVLLVALNAKYIHSNLAVHSLKAYAGKYSEHIGLLELTINHSEEVILKEIYKQKADMVAFSCYIWNIGIVKRVSAELKKVQPSVKIWYGGPEVSYDTEQCLQEIDQLDGIMLGEGEQTFLELMEYYVDGTRELATIAGLAYKEELTKNSILIERASQEGSSKHNRLINGTSIENTSTVKISEENISEEITSAKNKDILLIPSIPRTVIVQTPVREPMLMDMIPFPYEDMEIFKNKIIYYESSRGCPFSCSYCLSSIDKRVRFRSTHLVKRELGLLLEYKVPQVKFVDRTFNCYKKHAMEIWSFIKENDNGITNFHFEISADLLDNEEIEFLSTLRPGHVQLEIGVQTTNPDTAEVIHRTMDFQKLSDNVNRIKKAKNIHQHLDLIAGLPLESYASFEKSFEDVYRLKPDQLQLGFLKILKGSSMETDSGQYGITYRDNAPYEVLFTEALPYQELLRLKGVCEMVEVYYNSGQFTYSIAYLEHFYSSPMKLYQEISDYYEHYNYDMLSHNRMRRSEILLEFFQQKVMTGYQEEEKATQAALFKEILILDIFQREDMKSRPSFATPTSQQNNLRELYETQHILRKAIHIEAFVYDVINSSITGQVIKKPMHLVFDYGDRDPLNKGAKIITLE